MPLFSAKLGLFGAHPVQFVQVWVHLIECFKKIDKPQTAFKCFVRAMEEINYLLQSSAFNSKSDIAEKPDEEVQKFTNETINKMTNMTKTGRNNQLQASDKEKEQIIETLKTMQMHLDKESVQTIIPECLECLTLGAAIMPDDDFSLQLSITAFKILNKA